MLTCFNLTVFIALIFIVATFYDDPKDQHEKKVFRFCVALVVVIAFIVNILELSHLKEDYKYKTYEVVTLPNGSQLALNQDGSININSRFGVKVDSKQITIIYKNKSGRFGLYRYQDPHGEIYNDVN